MDLITPLLLVLEAAFGFWLLYRAGVLDTRRRLVISALLLVLAFLLPCVTYQYHRFTTLKRKGMAVILKSGSSAAPKRISTGLQAMKEEVFTLLL